MANTIAQNIDDLTVPGTEPAGNTVDGDTALGLGATPKQADMAGAQAHKIATMQERIDSAAPQQEELFRARRMETPRQELTVAESLQKERQEQLAGLGNIGKNIQNTIDARIKSTFEGAATGLATREVEQDIVAGALGLTDPEQIKIQAEGSAYDRISKSLAAFMANPNPGMYETALQEIQLASGGAISTARAKEMLGLAQNQAAQTGQYGAEQLMDTLTLGEIGDSGFQELGFQGGMAEVEQMLGLDSGDLSGMTMDQLSDTIEGVQQAEFSRIEGLKAKMATAPSGSLQREILMRELRDLGAVGITGVEAEVAETVEDIDMGGYIQVGDQRLRVDEFLADDHISEMIMDFINEKDLTKKDAIIPATPEFEPLRAWIAANGKALATVSQTADDTREVYEQANADYQKANVVAGLDLDDEFMNTVMGSTGWDPNKPVTSAQLQDFKVAFNSTALGQIALTDSIPKLEKQDIINKLSNSRMPPDALKSFLDLSADELQTAHQTAERLDNNDTLADLTGMYSTNGFIKDNNWQRHIKEMGDAVDIVRERAPQALNTTSPAWEHIKTMSPQELSNMTDDGYKALERYAEKSEDLMSVDVSDPQSMVEFALGEDVEWEDMVDKYNDIQHWAKLGDAGARQNLKQFDELFGRIPPGQNFDTPLGHDDARAIMNRLADRLNGTSASQAMDGTGKFDLSHLKALSRGGQSVGFMNRGAQSAGFQTHQGYLTPEGALDIAKLGTMGDAERQAVLDWARKAGGIGGMPADDWNTGIAYADEEKKAQNAVVGATGMGSTEEFDAWTIGISDATVPASQEAVAKLDNALQSLTLEKADLDAHTTDPVVNARRAAIDRAIVGVNTHRGTLLQRRDAEKFKVDTLRGLDLPIATIQYWQDKIADWIPLEESLETYKQRFTDWVDAAKRGQEAGEQIKISMDEARYR